MTHLPPSAVVKGLLLLRSLKDPEALIAYDHSKLSKAHLEMSKQPLPTFRGGRHVQSQHLYSRGAEKTRPSDGRLGVAFYTRTQLIAKEYLYKATRPTHFSAVCRA